MEYSLLNRWWEVKCNLTAPMMNIDEGQSIYECIYRYRKSHIDIGIPSNYSTNVLIHKGFMENSWSSTNILRFLMLGMNPSTKEARIHE